ncbi:hypothetical protein MPDQ_007917 [Monascus purpureus]|uniref:Uncharacterized protein n=1 Tax=Monascus purpureus TaxID=5098 RepID=A0A507QUK5_MONPU|nr:hypothetical protein MPDQ_007917 [Monascus purpureus]
MSCEETRFNLDISSDTAKQVQERGDEVAGPDEEELMTKTGREFQKKKEENRNFPKADIIDAKPIGEGLTAFPQRLSSHESMGRTQHGFSPVGLGAYSNDDAEVNNLALGIRLARNDLDSPHSPAEVLSFLLERKKSPSDAVTDVEDWVVKANEAESTRRLIT